MMAKSTDCINLSKLPPLEITTLLENIETILFDCDGTLWVMDKPIPGSVEVYNALWSMRKKLFLISSNSTRPRSVIADKARKMKYNVKDKQVINAAFLTATYLNDMFFSKKVYVVGALGISEELEKADIENFGAGPDNSPVDFESTWDTIEIKPNVGAVVVGHDVHISYVKLLKAVTYLENKKCLFIGTNQDERISSSPALVLPGAGTMLKAIEVSAKRQPVILGKPSPYVNDYLIEKFTINPRNTLIIGDSCIADIGLGYKCGYITVLVLSGETTMENLKYYMKHNPEYVPDFYLDTLGDLMTFFKSKGISK